jgi:hypothetical protein
MMNLKSLFSKKLIRPQIGDRVRNNLTHFAGTVIGTSKVSGSVKVYTLTVQYDSGAIYASAAENEFIKIGRA